MNDTFVRAGTEALLDKILKNQEKLDRRILTMERLLQRMLAADDHKTYNVAEVSSILGVHPNTVRRYIANSQLEVLPGTRYKIPGHSIKKFIRNSERADSIPL